MNAPRYFHRYLCGCIARVWDMDFVGRLYEVTRPCEAHARQSEPLADPEGPRVPATPPDAPTGHDPEGADHG